MIKSPTYKFYQYNRQRSDGSTNVRIVAVSSFAGKSVKGYADLHPHDEFDIEYGKALAAARCAEKIEKKREARATRLLKKANDQLAMAQKYVADMTAYHTDAVAELAEAQTEVADILATM